MTSQISSGIAAGVDIGSRTTKIVLLDRGTLAVRASGVANQGPQQEKLALDLLDRLLDDAALTPADLAAVIATGYGRSTFTPAQRTITEITCQARGVRHLVPGARTIIDIGGQDSKLIQLDADGSVADFAMNDRCAAGTGCFLEITAQRLHIAIDRIGAAARTSRSPAAITSTCAVFSETEIVGLLAAGTPPEDIVAGVQNSIARRVAAMAGRLVQPPIVLTGGVALIDGMRESLEAVLSQPVAPAPTPQLTAALGAALLAAESRK